MVYGASVDNWPELAFVRGEITGKQYIENFTPANPKKCNIQHHEGVVWVWSKTRKLKPWEVDNKDYRGGVEYKEWRKSVFARDNFTCKECGSSDHNIEAHHIKKYHDFPKLRLTVSNGLTLCKPCHKLQHKKVL